MIHLISLNWIGRLRGSGLRKLQPKYFHLYFVPSLHQFLPTLCKQSSNGTGLVERPIRHSRANFLCLPNPALSDRFSKIQELVIEWRDTLSLAFETQGIRLLLSQTQAWPWEESGVSPGSTSPDLPHLLSTSGKNQTASRVPGTDTSALLLFYFPLLGRYHNLQNHSFDTGLV